MWVGQLTPSATSPTYTVRLTFGPEGRPSVHVLDPPLDPGHRERLPHVYAGDELCLYMPGEWDRCSLLATTVIPWVAEWLFHYELWKVTDSWTGGGHLYATEPPDDPHHLHPGPPQRRFTA